VDSTIFTAMEDTDVCGHPLHFLFRTLVIPVNPLPDCHKGHRYRLQTLYLAAAKELVSASDVFLHYCVTAMCRLCFLSIAVLSSVSVATHSSSDICLTCPGPSSIQNHNGTECVNTFKHKFDPNNV
jgi:hypothetical protein